MRRPHAFRVLCLLIGVGCWCLGETSARPVMAGENYAFLVAVGDYDVKQLKPLSYTRNDILEFSQVLVRSGFAPENIVLMHDDLKLLQGRRNFPEAAKIRRELKLLLAGLQADDTLIAAFSGHGVQFSGEKQNYFCPADADLEDRQTLISLSEVYDVFRECPARRKLLLVDACRNDPQSALAKSRATVELESLSRPQTEAVPEGILALFSCASNQTSYEWPDLKHGIFFYHVIQGWKGDADDGDKELSLDEIVSYSRKRTQAFARQHVAAIQTPQLKGEFSGTWILRRLGTRDITNTLNMKLAYIPPGEFLMGSPGPEPTETGERPQHRVRITKPFYIGIHEVTVGNFKTFTSMAGDPTSKGVGYNVAQKSIQVGNYTWKNTGWPQGDQHPVTNVSWQDAADFCRWISRKEGITYRLPTEAEWEYACRADSITLYNTGDSEESLQGAANVADASFKKAVPAVFAQPGYYDYTKRWNDGFPFTAPVGSFKPNAFGLYDMHGNVQEWCADWFGLDYYKKSPTDDPQGPADGTHRIKRGGDWVDYTTICTSTFRRSEVVNGSRSHFVGFRVVRDP